MEPRCPMNINMYFWEVAKIQHGGEGTVSQDPNPQTGVKEEQLKILGQKFHIQMNIILGGNLMSFLKPF